MNKCPVCKTDHLEQIFLEEDLPANKCNGCGGVWLRANEYLIWLRGRQKPLTGQPQWAGEKHEHALVADAALAKLCPDCGRFLRRYNVWPGSDLHLERCSTCNGVWFDCQEWQALKQKNLHDKITLIFTKHWQKRLREEESRRRFEKMYQDRFGEKDYDAIKRVRRWLDNNPQRSGLLAYLLDEHPYSG